MNVKDEQFSLREVFGDRSPLRDAFNAAVVGIEIAIVVGVVVGVAIIAPAAVFGAAAAALPIACGIGVGIGGILGLAASVCTFISGEAPKFCYIPGRRKP